MTNTYTGREKKMRTLDKIAPGQCMFKTKIVPCVRPRFYPLHRHQSIICRF